jgi:hypothetical protein
MARSKAFISRWGGAFAQPVALQRAVGVLGNQLEQVELARGERLLAAVADPHVPQRP